MKEANRARELFAWQEKYLVPGTIWYMKRLSANDTLASKAHQAGPYIPRGLMFAVFPELQQEDMKNPDTRFDLHVDSHGQRRTARAVWYNNKLFGKTRDETRITNLGGKSSPLLDAGNTGAITIFAFIGSDSRTTREAHIWVCWGVMEEALMEDLAGPVEPGQGLACSLEEDALPFPPLPRSDKMEDCRLAVSGLPDGWLEKFPTGAEIAGKAIDICPAGGLSPDERLLKRRGCEYELFLVLEDTLELPAFRKGFASLEAYLSHAQSVLQRRKARSGLSLELHLREIFIEEGLREEVDFSHGVETEPGRRPDFIFPSRSRYDNYPDSQLRMLGVKTTCRDRWRQILNEAGRIPIKHLLTLQEGVSARQFQEMEDSGVQLVVPASLHRKYPQDIQPRLITLAAFIEEVKSIT